jgi:hypothetical protein
MAGGFAITTTTTSAKLPANRQGQFQFTVTNTSGRQLTVRGRAVAQTPEQNGWFTIEGPTERLCAPNATLTYTVNVAIPATAPTTPITFRLDAVGVENPDEYNSQGPAIVLEVPPASVPNKPFPWWIVAVAAAVILLLGGGGALAYHFVSSTNKPVAKASPTPSHSPSPSPTPDLVPRFLGTWEGADVGYGPSKLVIGRSGSGTNVNIDFSAWCFQGTHGYNCSSGPVVGAYNQSQDMITVLWTQTYGDGTYNFNLTARLVGNTMAVSLAWTRGPHNFQMTKTSCAPNCLFERPRPFPTAIAIGS